MELLNNNNKYPKPMLKQNDTLAKKIIGLVSVVIFLVVVGMGKYKPLLEVEFPFNRYLFAHIIGVLNSIVSILLVIALVQIKNKNVEGHKKTMLAAIITSVLFLVFYILHHISNADTAFGGVGFIRYIYYPLLISHIILAATILPFILFTAYQGLTNQFAKHKKLAKITWPLWLFVSASGVIVYLMIKPYYS
jgi:putative membrane protein